MNKELKVVAVSGGCYRPSRSLTLASALVDALSEKLVVKASIIELGDIAQAVGNALSRDQLPDSVKSHLVAIENADLLIVSSPVYRGSYPGLLKHLFDLVDINGLINTPVLLAATGGTERHSLVIEHHLRPLFSFFQSITLPIGVYASEADFTDYQVTSPM